ncbi:DgyrCDS1844 [Dimorphilus gyrociliatus]|uniref:DgyrCDS1844 n=1 Tax=Dimorphilus gyrociliatus TaxID=2664684 RepID=A0A7I8V9X5_9ANNE|nr:DgyrCDS1844 [Dimorphilus gyrociliatus]
MMENNNFEQFLSKYEQELRKTEEVDYSLLKVFFGMIILLPLLVFIILTIAIHIDSISLCSSLFRKHEEGIELDDSRYTPSRIVPKCNKRLKMVDFSTIIEERTYHGEDPINISSISRITSIGQEKFPTVGCRRLSESAEESPCASTPVESRYRAERLNSTYQDLTGIKVDNNYNEVFSRRRSEFSVNSHLSYDTEC